MTELPTKENNIMKFKNFGNESKHPFHIVADFESTLESINNTLNGCVVKIKRNGFLFDGHVTETEIEDKDCNRIIHNDSNILGEYEQNVIDTFKFIIREVK